jgi:hypothetical protein
LRHIDHGVIELDRDVAEGGEPLQNEFGGLELLALDHVGVTGIVPEHRMIELGNKRRARPVPELEYRRHEPDALHVVGKAVLGEKVERRGMRGGGAWVRPRPFVLVEQHDRNAAPSQEPRAEEPDRAAARDQDLPFVEGHGVRALCAPLTP